MTEIKIESKVSKEEKYKLLYKQIESLIENEENEIAKICNTLSAIHHTMNYFWSGFYFVHNKELQLSIFQGTNACSKIGYNKGVCGKAWATKNVIIVDDVEKFDGHIACSSLSKSEIVIPIYDEEKNVIGVFDVDSEKLNYFDDIDKLYIIEILNIIRTSILKFVKNNYIN